MLTPSAILLTFEVPALTVVEATATHDVAVIKQDGMVTERDIMFNITADGGNASYGIILHCPVSLTLLYVTLASSQLL